MKTYYFSTHGVGRFLIDLSPEVDALLLLLVALNLPDFKNDCILITLLLKKI